MTFKVRRTRKAVLPNLVWDRKTLTTIGDVAAAGVVDNVLKQRQEDGSRIKVNALSTRLRKLRGGRVPWSLIDKDHRFIQGNRASFTHRFRGVGPLRTVIVYPTTDELKKLVRWVQEKGYIGWFGISKTTADAIIEVVRDFIKSQIRKATQGRK